MPYWVSHKKHELPTEGMEVTGWSVHSEKSMAAVEKLMFNQEGQPHTRYPQAGSSQSSAVLSYTAILVWSV